MKTQDREPDIGQGRFSRRAVVKGGVAAAAVAAATLLTTREGGAAVTSMDRAPALQPLSTDDTSKSAGKPER